MSRKISGKEIERYLAKVIAHKTYEKLKADRDKKMDDYVKE